MYKVNCINWLAMLGYTKRIYVQFTMFKPMRVCVLYTMWHLPQLEANQLIFFKLILQIFTRQFFMNCWVQHFQCHFQKDDEEEENQLKFGSFQSSCDVIPWMIFLEAQIDKCSWPTRVSWSLIKHSASAKRRIFA